MNEGSAVGFLLDVDNFLVGGAGVCFRIIYGEGTLATWPFQAPTS